MKRSRFFVLAVLLITSIQPAQVAFASPSAQESVSASAVVVPVQVTELGFIIPALVKEITVKEGEQVQSGQTLGSLDAPEAQYSVAAAEAALRSAEAEAKVQSYRRVKDRRNGRVFFDVVPPEVRQVADAKVQQAQAALEVMQASIAQNTLISPHDGTIASVNVVPGEFVQLGQVVLTLATLDQFQIETTDLSERDITNVHLGDSANVSFDALNTNVSGRVVGISPIADTVGGDIVFKVTIALDEQPRGLLWGMTAEVTIGEYKRSVKLLRDTEMKTIPCLFQLIFLWLNQSTCSLNSEISNAPSHKNNSHWRRFCIFWREYFICDHALEKIARLDACPGGSKCPKPGNRSSPGEQAEP